MDRSNIPFRPTAFSRQAAFTLIELLVVIVVIAILAALLLSALQSAKLRAQQIRCLNNLRQMAIARQMYWDDFGFFQNSSPGPYSTWPDRFKPYGMTSSLLLCPSTFATNSGPVYDSLQGTADHPWVVPASSLDYRDRSMSTINVGSYALNIYFTQPWYLTDGWQFGRRTPAHPSETPVFGENISPVDGPLGDALPATNLYTGSLTTYYPTMGDEYRGMSTFTIARHGKRSASAAPRHVDISKPLPGAIDLALYDGHVEKAPLETLWTYYWSANWWIPSPRPGER